MVHLNRVSSNLRGDVKRVLTMGRLLKNFHKEFENIKNKMHMMPIRMINFATNLAIYPLPCFLSICRPRIIRAGGAPRNGGKKTR